MSGLIESATAILSASERRLEIVANNVANITTPGFKRQLSFMAAMSSPVSAGPGAMAPQVRADLGQGGMSETGNALDLAIGGPGFFQLRADGAFVYSRQGQFHLAEDGLVISPQGHVLQLAGGGDLVLESAEAVRILADGTVLDGERPLGRIALFAPAPGVAAEPLAGSLFALPADGVEEVEAPQLRQRMIETSNVVLGDEMVTIMAMLRQAETGARIVQLYDELIGRAITVFGQRA